MSHPIADDFAGIAARTKPASVVANPEDRDAHLLALCAAFHRQHAKEVALSAAIQTDEDFVAMDEAQVLRFSLSDQIRDTPAKTLAGHRAKAAVALAIFDEMRDGQGKDYDIAFAMAVLRDFSGRTSA